MTTLLKPSQTIAFVMSPRLGDSLLAMIIVHNLERNGYKVTVFSNYLFALKNWFSANTILPYPEAASGRELLSGFDVLLHTYPVDVLFQSNQWHPQVIILDNQPLYRRCISMVDLQVCVCDELFGLKNLVRTNGLTPPAALKNHFYAKRIIVHPTASTKNRHWPANRFINLAQRLSKKGYQVIFTAAAIEKAQLGWITDHNFTLLICDSLDELAGFIYESGWFIGNDSGIGHLASNLNIPTVTVMTRRKMRIRWRPNWALGVGLLPWAPLIIRALKERYWKYFISPTRVINAFEQLQTRSLKTHTD